VFSLQPPIARIPAYYLIPREKSEPYTALTVFLLSGRWACSLLLGFTEKVCAMVDHVE